MAPPAQSRATRRSEGATATDIVFAMPHATLAAANAQSHSRGHSVQRAPAPMRVAHLRVGDAWRASASARHAGEESDVLLRSALVAALHRMACAQTASVFAARAGRAMLANAARAPARLSHVPPMESASRADANVMRVGKAQNALSTEPQQRLY